jgi:outer membrane protein assembly factor BamB
MSVMRWLAQMAPTVDGNRVFAVTSNGDYVCLAADTGKELWRKHCVSDLGGKTGVWGLCDYPLVDKDRLIICPGGDTNTVAALDKATGRVVWSCPIPGERAAHSVLVAADIAGVRQYVTHLERRMVGVAAADGKRLWSYDGMGTRIASTHAPVVRGDEVFYASGYGAGHVLLKVSREGEDWKAAEVYRGRNNDYVPWLGSPTRDGDHLVINTIRGLRYLDWGTGKAAWEEKLGRCTYTVADGKLFLRDQKGAVILAAADPAGYRERARFAPPRPDSGQPAWTFPVVANGRLYVRDYDALLCYDVRDPGRPRGKQVPDAVFVPTPDDVVAKMLELAEVKKADVVYDLGSGDGRVVIAAAKASGCKAVGVEIDRDLVALSRQKGKEAGVENLVTFERGDLFESDFSGATVVALYILPSMSQKLVPKLDKLRPGSRIVSHAFGIPGVVPDQVVKVTSAEDEVERPVYLYTVPLRREKPARR